MAPKRKQPPKKVPVKKVAQKKPAAKALKKPRHSRGGRPSAYSDKVAGQILEKVANTSQGLETICKKNKSLPHAATIRRWIKENREGFRDLYARAKEDQADVLADEIIEITDRLDDLPEGKLTHEKIAAARARADARKWVASKLKPKKYGDKIDHTTDGESLNKGFYDFLRETSQQEQSEHGS